MTLPDTNAREERLRDLRQRAAVATDSLGVVRPDAKAMLWVLDELATAERVRDLTNEARGSWQASCEAAEAEVAALRERVASLSTSLQWALAYIADGERDTPPHACEFFSNPEKGACDFHEAYFAAAALLSPPEPTRDA